MKKIKIICKNCNSIVDVRLKNVKKDKEKIAKCEKLLEETKKKDDMYKDILEVLYKRYKEEKNSKKFKILNILTLGLYGITHASFETYLQHIDKTGHYWSKASDLGMLSPSTCRDFHINIPKGISITQYDYKMILNNLNKKKKYFKCSVCGYTNYIELK